MPTLLSNTFFQASSPPLNLPYLLKWQFPHHGGLLVGTPSVQDAETELTRFTVFVFVCFVFFVLVVNHRSLFHNGICTWFLWPHHY